MQPFDWGRFVTRMNIKAPVEKIYAQWASRTGMESWFLRLCEYKQPDGTLLSADELVVPGVTYRWLWHGWPDETTEMGTILNCNGKDFLQFSMGKAGTCSINISCKEDEQIVELLQENIPDSEEGRHYYHVGCKTGWTFYMTNLKSILEGGIDLRNKNERLGSLLNL